MSDPSIGAVTTSAPPPTMCEEPTATNSAGNETLVCVCVDPSSAAEVAAEAGAKALVERFGGSQGAGGTGEVPEEPEMPAEQSCSDDALRAIGACGAAIGAAVSSAGVLTLVAAIGCAGALDGYIECTENQDRTR